jgi:hypothetical protein
LFDTAADAHQKLTGTVILYKDRPVKIVAVAGDRDIVVDCKYPESRRWGSTFNVFLSDPGFDWKSLGTRLGYMNFDFFLPDYAEAVFISRTPVRASTQGLSDRTVEYEPLHLPPDIMVERNVGFWDFALSEGFSAMLVGQYPSLEEAMKILKKSARDETDIKSVAISRDSAIYWDRIGQPYVLYKRRKVGTTDGSAIKIADHVQWLSETFESGGFKIA